MEYDLATEDYVELNPRRSYLKRRFTQRAIRKCLEALKVVTSEAMLESDEKKTMEPVEQQNPVGRRAVSGSFEIAARQHAVMLHRGQGQT